MPEIYRVKCATCTARPEAQDSLAGWVTMDGRQGGKILPEGYLAVRLDDGTLAPLPHPLEASTLKGLGFSWNSAFRQGRLFRVSYKLCQRCGAIHEEKRHAAGQAGCLLGLTVAPAIIFILMFGFGAGWLPTFFGAFLCMYLAFGIAEMFNWLRWRKADFRSKIRSCPKCQGTMLLTLNKAVGKVLPCPNCERQSLSVEFAGKS